MEEEGATNSAGRCCWKLWGTVLQSSVTVLMVASFLKWEEVEIVTEVDILMSKFIMETLHLEQLFWGMLDIVLALSLVITLLCTFWFVRRGSEKDALKKRAEQRQQEVEEEKEAAGKVLRRSLLKEKQSDSDLDEDLNSDLDDEEIISYHKPIPIQDIGGRLQKYWSLDDSKTEIRCMAKKSSICHLRVQDFDKVNHFLKSLDHPCIQKILSVKLEESNEDSQVIIAQQYWTKGSLRDFIYRVEDPMADWEQKYKVGLGRPLPTEQVAIYGWQILQAMLFLYKQKFSHSKQLCPLGQVQSGNILIIDNDKCVLGGYENVLLGYRASLYKTLAHNELLKDIDIIMFGHVMYEMCTGNQLNNIFPTKEEYEIVMDDTCLEILIYIFRRNRKGHSCHSIKRISGHKFFIARRRYGRNRAESIIKNVMGSLRHVKSIGESITKSMREKLTHKSHVGKEHPSDSEISGSMDAAHTGRITPVIMSQTSKTRFLATFLVAKLRLTAVSIEISVFHMLRRIKNKFYNK